jgi:Tfp pilus assembly protein PilF
MNPMTSHQQVEAALIHHRAGRLAEAEAIYRQILAKDPNYTDALHLLGSLAAQLDNNDAAIDLLQRAIRLNPNIAPYHGNLGAVFMKLKRHDEAVASLRRAIQINPNAPDVYYNLGATLTELNDFDGAFSAFNKGLALHPNWPEMHSTIGTALRKVGKFAEAIASLHRAIALQPNHPEAHWNLAHSLLMLGDFTNGLREYEWRNQIPTVVRPRNFPPPAWNGENLNGKTILLHAEQGMGDTLQFIRYVPDVIARGGRVIVECPPDLKKILHGVQGIQEIFVQHQTLPHFDTHCSIMSLPFTLQTTEKTIPAKVPYISIPENLTAAWLERVKDGNPRIGLVWAGSIQHNDDRRRSMRLEHFAPLSAIKSAKFFMLQKGPPAAQAATAPPELNLINFTADLHDFIDTAALIQNLDVVISVDTSVAHLAGALGKPVYLLLPTVPDWRWMLNRSDSPWYPSMRLFRQTKAGDWTTVIAEVAQALKGRA